MLHVPILCSNNMKFVVNEQEEARLEAVRRRIKELNEHEPTSSQLAKAVGMRGSSLEKVLCNGRESKERIFKCYKRLVISIASSYQGKGLTLEDLVQVSTHFPIWIASTSLVVIRNDENQLHCLLVCSWFQNVVI